MTKAQMTEYDLFLDENDWDIYYWATQETPAAITSSASDSSSPSYASGAEAAAASETVRAPAQGEWAQTIGTYRPAYRPVPSRWADSDVLRLLREHVKRRSKGGEEGGGMGFMPALKT
jgi:hypothetical protein